MGTTRDINESIITVNKTEINVMDTAVYPSQKNKRHHRILFDIEQVCH